MGFSTLATHSLIAVMTHLIPACGQKKWSVFFLCDHLLHFSAKSFVRSGRVMRGDRERKGEASVLSRHSPPPPPSQPWSTFNFQRMFILDAQ